MSDKRVGQNLPKPKKHLPEEHIFKPHQKEYVLAQVATGRTIKSLSKELGFKLSIIWHMCEQDTVFRDGLARARVQGVDSLVDDILEISDEEPDVQRARLKTDNIKWIASKLQPNKYGDRIDVNVTNSIDLNQAMVEAKKRMMEKMPQVIDITPQIGEEPEEDEGIFK